MCGFTGFYNANATYLNHHDYFCELIQKMCITISHRGADGNGMLLTDQAGLGHVYHSLKQRDLIPQPFSCNMYQQTFHIILCGNIFNFESLRNTFTKNNISCDIETDTELLLFGFLEYGASFFAKLDGSFTAAIYEEERRILTLVRDCFGTKPLFYSYSNETLLFGSEIKALLAHPNLTPSLGKHGLQELFGLGPARTPGEGILEGISEVKPAHYLTCTPSGIAQTPYWRLCSKPHTDSYEQTIEHTTFLVTDAVKRQIQANTEVCTFLSGGVDSSIVSAICANEYVKEGKKLSTYSFDFTENERYFQSNSFQPSIDRPYVDIMVNSLGSEHHYLECSPNDLFLCLKDSVHAHDLPAMADVDSSLLYFCNCVKGKEQVVLTGECADEVFGGYPWFHRKDLLNLDTFPWTPTLAPRKELLNRSFLDLLDLDTYVKDTYNTALQDVDLLPSDSAQDMKKRQIAHLCLYWFMNTLLNRMDRCSMHSGINARVPFADRNLVEYVYNVPWDMKIKDGTIKNLLRQSSIGLVPDEILFRKKSPFPKTYHPDYDNQLKKALSERLEDSTSILHHFLNKTSISTLLTGDFQKDTPWYGQLMAGPQMLAYLYQIDYWIKAYQIELTI